jgi:hypothetical protein
MGIPRQAGGGGGGGGTATLLASTVGLESNDTDVYAGEKQLLSVAIGAAGAYLIGGAMQVEPGGAGSILVAIDSGGIGRLAWQQRTPPAYSVDSLAIPMFCAVLDGSDTIYLVGSATNGTPGNGAIGPGAGADVGTWLTVAGPLAMTVT